MPKIIKVGIYKFEETVKDGVAQIKPLFDKLSDIAYYALDEANQRWEEIDLIFRDFVIRVKPGTKSLDILKQLKLTNN